MKSLALYFLVWIVTVSLATAQNAEIDSLRRVLAHTRQDKDTRRVLALVQLASAYNRYSADSSLKLAQSALMLARRISFKKGEARALYMVSLALRGQCSELTSYSLFFSDLQTYCTSRLEDSLQSITRRKGPDSQGSSRIVVGPHQCLIRLQLLQYDPEKRLPLKDVRKHPWIVMHRSKSGSTATRAS